MDSAFTPQPAYPSTNARTDPPLTGSEQLIQARMECSEKGVGMRPRCDARYAKAKFGSHVKVARKRSMYSKSNPGLSSQSLAAKCNELAPHHNGSHRQAIKPISWYMGSQDTTEASEPEAR